MMHGIAVLLHEDGTVARGIDTVQRAQAIYELAGACADELRLADPELNASMAHRLMMRAHMVSYLNAMGETSAQEVLRDLLGEISHREPDDPDSNWNGVSIR